MDSEKIAFQGELMLAGWSQTHNGGAKVTFWLESDEDLEAFKHMTVRKGNHAGQRFMAVLVELDENDQPAGQKRDKPGGLLMSALTLCRTEAFQKFCHDRLSWELGENPEDHAARVIRAECRVESRSDLDKSPTARELFGRLMAQYREWCAANGIEHGR